MADTVVGRGAVSGVVSCGAVRWGRVGSARRCPCVLFPVGIIIIMRVSRCLVFFCVFPFALGGGVLILGRRWCPTTMGWVRDGVCAMILDDHAGCKCGIG